MADIAKTREPQPLWFNPVANLFDARATLIDELTRLKSLNAFQEACPQCGHDSARDHATRIRELETELETLEETITDVLRILIDS